MIKNIKKQGTEWEKIFANHISYKRLESRISKELLQIKNKKINNPIKNRQRIKTDISPKKIYKWLVST